LPEPRFPEKRAVRRSFERAAATYDRHNFLQGEIGLRLLKHLEPIRLDPKTIVDVGCGTGHFFDALRKRFPGRSMVGVDIALPMLAQARGRTPWWRKVTGAGAPALVAADAERLPLAGGCADFVFSNLALQWCRPEAVFAEASRILRPGGLFLFSSFGPDTLKELRAWFAGVEGFVTVNRFVDMHDGGDGVVHAGFADRVLVL
jgi:malonyl-CoA O-methyltransferase